jgi:hypothetical protein
MAEPLAHLGAMPQSGVINGLAGLESDFRSTAQKQYSKSLANRMAASRQKLPLAKSNSNFRFAPESRLNSDVASCPKSAGSGQEIDPSGQTRLADRGRAVFLFFASSVVR